MSEEFNEGTPEFLEGWEDLVFQTVFGLEKKYSRFLKKRQIISTSEAEADRSKVSNAFQYLTEISWHVVDASLYSDFVEMHDLREKLMVDDDVTLRDRYLAFAHFVQRHCSPIVFVLSNTLLNNFQGNTLELLNEEVITTEDTTVTEFKERFDVFRNVLNTRFMTAGERMQYEKELYERLKNKTFNKNELEKILSAFEAELLSKLISEKKLIAEVKGDLITFKTKIGTKPKTLPAALLLNPAKNKKKTRERNA